MRSPRVVLVTAEKFQALDADLPLLVRALEAEGCSATVAAWDDASVDWSVFDLAVLRSTWNYYRCWHVFNAWLEAASRAVPLFNALPVVRWNADKHYLMDLVMAGVPVVPTRYIEPHGEMKLPADGDFVVKPTVSAGAQDSAVYRASEHAAARKHVRMLHEGGRTAMVQPFLRHLDAQGERSLIFFAGIFSHAVRKGPVLKVGQGIDNDKAPTVDVRAHLPSEEELELASRVLRAVPYSRPDQADLLYARVDVVPDPQGFPMVMEVELIEPFLFLSYGESATLRLAKSLVVAATNAQRRS